MKHLHNVKLWYRGEKVYDENLPFTFDQDIDENIKDFISFIRPNLQYDYTLHSYVRDLKPNER